MSEMIERVALAIDAAPAPIVRRNKARTDGLQYEVVVVNDDQPIAEDNQRLIGAYATSDEAEAAFEREFDRLRGTAAIEAMRKPTGALAEALQSYALRDEEPVAIIWDDLIDAALKTE